LDKDFSVPLASTTISAPAQSASRSATRLREAGIVLAGSAFVAVCAHVVVPLGFTPVPLTLQTFAVLLLGLLLTPRLAAGTLTAYLVEGLLGLPVFAPTPVMPGLAHLLGPTGGYLLAYPAAAFLIAFVWRNIRRSFPGALGSAVAGNFLILGCGGLWLAVLTHASLQSVLTLGVVPFLPGEGLKIAAAAGIALGYQRYRRRAL
jgi:biotin transport system substrate-specific component